MANQVEKDKNYDLVSALYHSAKGAELSRTFAQDAKKEGDNEAEEFFNSCQERYAELGKKAKDLLKKRL